MAPQPINPPPNPVPGAIYIETSSVGRLTWVWTGVSWTTAGGSDGYNSQIRTGMAITPGFYSGLSTTGASGGSNLSQIATQYGPTAPVNPAFGQTWIDTTDSTRPVTYIWTSPGQWTKTSDGTTNTFVQVDEPTIATAGSLEKGDLWYNTSTTEFHVYDGTDWQQAGGPGQGSIAVGIQPLATAPSIQPESYTYYNTTENKLYISNGSSWVEVTQAPDIDSHSIVSLTEPTAHNGEAIVGGDMWWDTSTKTLKIRDDSSFPNTWVRISSPLNGDAHVFRASGAALSGQPTTRPDGTAHKEGDIWLDTDTRHLYVSNGTTFDSILSPNDNNTHTIPSTIEPTSRINTPTDPTRREGDLWINTNTHTLSYYTGLAWVAVASSGGGGVADYQEVAVPVGANYADGFPGTKSTTAALTTGDIFRSLSTGRSYYSNGAGGWLPFGSFTHVSETTPNPAEVVDNDTWVIPSTNSSFTRYNNSGSPTWIQTV